VDEAHNFGLKVAVHAHGPEGIKVAIRAAADLLGVSAQVGSIEPGKRADLIAVRGDPLADVRLLESVAFVMKQGEIYGQD
jgi:imidazolonepropionase-like amidohydrolase